MNESHKEIVPIIGSLFRAWIVCAVISACIWNSYGMIYKESEMQYKQINDTININQNSTNDRN